MHKIKFFPNTRDNTHCVQACLKSVLKYYFPRERYNFEYLDKVSCHQKGKWTWDTSWMVFMARLGFDIVYISSFDYKKFSKEGIPYLEKIWSKEIYDTQRKFSNFEIEQHNASKLLKNKKVRFLKRPSTINDLRRFFKKGYMLLCPINPNVLEGRKGYSSHLVLVTDLRKNMVTFHDPGLPPVENNTASTRKFLIAMGYPTKNDTTLIAVSGLTPKS